MIHNAGEQSVLTTAQAAQLLSVHESSIKRWCNEGILPNEKTEGRHRRIYLADLIAFSKSQGPAAPIARFHPHAARVYEAVEGAVRDSDASALVEAAKWFIGRGEFFQLKNLFHFVLDDQRLGKSFLFDRFFTPLLNQVGEEWESGHTSVAVEHYVSECLSEALSHARYAHFSMDEKPSRTALVSCSEGNWHSFGSQGAQIILQASGYAVHYLGVSTPYDDLAKLAGRLACGTLVLSFARPQSLYDIHRCLGILSELSEFQKPPTLHIGANFLPANFPASVDTPFPVFFHRTLGSFENHLNQETRS